MTGDALHDFAILDMRREAWETEHRVGFCYTCGMPVYRDRYLRHVMADDGKIVHPNNRCIKGLFRSRGELFDMLIDAYDRSELENIMLDGMPDDWLMEKAEENGWIQR